MQAVTRLTLIVSTLLTATAVAQPYDFSAADALLTAELPDMYDHVAVIVRQDGTELYRFQAGDIDYDTQVRMASVSKTVSAGVVLSVVDDGLIALDERLGDAYWLFQQNGIGDPTVLDCWSIRHGIRTPRVYELSPIYTLAQSVVMIGATGYLVFTPGTELDYNGVGMQTVAGLAARRTLTSWEDLARARILDPCSMPDTDYGMLRRNPAVAGGMRSTANDSINYAQMIIDNGQFAGQAVLTPAAVDTLFTNNTRDLPVRFSPWPTGHPQYPYGADPDYGFGAWVLADHPVTGHVEEIVAAGALGSYVWLDRRRGLTAVLITEVPAGTQASLDAMMGLCTIARQQTEAAQVQRLTAVDFAGQVCLRWQAPAGSTGTRVYGANEPIRDIYDLRAATLLALTTAESANVPHYDYYAAVAVFDSFVDTALVPAGNATTAPPAAPDLDASGSVDLDDFVILHNDLGNAGPAAPGDVDGDGDTDLADFAHLQNWLATSGC